MAASGKETPASREHFRVAAGIYPDQCRMRDRVGNVWRITGEYGGAAFVLLYLVFLVSRVAAAQAFDGSGIGSRWGHIVI